MSAATKEVLKKLSHLEFLKLAIPRLRSDGRKGVNPQFSGLNEAACKYFDISMAEWKAITGELAKSGEIVIRPMSYSRLVGHDKKGNEIREQAGSVILYLAGEAPTSDKANDVLKDLGLA